MGVNTEEAVITEMYRKQWACMVAKDISGMKDLFSNAFTLTHMTGVTQSKEDFLRSIQDGTLNYYSAVHDEIRVDINGDTAYLKGKSVVNAAVYGGGRHTWHLQGDYTLKRMDGKWLFTASKASTY